MVLNHDSKWRSGNQTYQVQRSDILIAATEITRMHQISTQEQSGRNFPLAEYSEQRKGNYISNNNHGARNFHEIKNETWRSNRKFN
jgi:hypothetical protein